jgi:predicted Zn-dependent protease
VSIGEGMDSEIRQQSPILADAEWNKYINDIGNSIAMHCDRTDITYHFAVIDSNMVNAFAAPGGYIYFYSGLLKAMDNEAELAAVMAHEISHVVARHTVKRIQLAMGVDLLQKLLLGEGSEGLNTAIGIGLGLSFANYSRDNEREADEYGIIYMTRAGYDPGASVTMFEKLAAMSDGTSNFFEGLTRSHPETVERIANAKAQIASMSLSSNLTLNAGRYATMKARLR